MVLEDATLAVAVDKPRLVVQKGKPAIDTPDLTPKVPVTIDRPRQVQKEKPPLAKPKVCNLDDATPNLKVPQKFLFQKDKDIWMTHRDRKYYNDILAKYGHLEKEIWAWRPTTPDPLRYNDRFGVNCFASGQFEKATQYTIVPGPIQLKRLRRGHGNRKAAVIPRGVVVRWHNEARLDIIEEAQISLKDQSIQGMTKKPGYKNHLVKLLTGKMGANQETQYILVKSSTNDTDMMEGMYVSDVVLPEGSRRRGKSHDPDDDHTLRKEVEDIRGRSAIPKECKSDVISIIEKMESNRSRENIIRGAPIFHQFIRNYEGLVHSGRLVSAGHRNKNKSSTHHLGPLPSEATFTDNDPLEDSLIHCTSARLLNRPSCTKDHIQSQRGHYQHTADNTVSLAWLNVVFLTLSGRITRRRRTAGNAPDRVANDANYTIPGLLVDNNTIRQMAEGNYSNNQPLPIVPCMQIYLTNMARILVENKNELVLSLPSRSSGGRRRRKENIIVMAESHSFQSGQRRKRRFWMVC